MGARLSSPVVTALLGLGLAGCAGEEAGAQVVVGLTTDMAVGFEIQRLEATARVDGAVVQSASFAYSDGNLALPAELFVPPAPDGAEVELTLSALRDGEAAPVVTRTAATRADGARTLLLPAALDAACAGVGCTKNTTCIQGECVDPFIAPSALPDYDPAWIDAAPDACKAASGGEPTLVIGRGQSAFAPLAEDEVVPIEAGAQGGHHVWLALRASGLRQMGSSLSTGGTFPDLGYELSSTISLVTLRRAGGGLCEIYGIRYQVDHGIAVETVGGQKLDIAITLKDPSGDVATAMKRVVISADIGP